MERLTQLLGCTIYELLAMCAEFDFNLADNCIKKDRWPSSLSLHFDLLEAAALLKRDGAVKHRPRKVVRPDFLKANLKI